MPAKQATTPLAEWQRAFAAPLLGAPISPDPRRAVYQHNVRHALGRALADTYPVTKRLLGDDCFSLLAQEYSAAHPPTSPVMAEYGRYLPMLLEQHGGHELLASLPWLADMVRFEWSVLQSSTAANADAVPPERWQQLPPQKLLQSTLTWHPSCRLFQSAHPVSAIWQIHQSPEGIPQGWPLPDEGALCLLYRSKDGMHVTDLTPSLYGAISDLMNGAVVGSVLARNDLSETDVAALIAALQHQIITDIRNPADAPAIT